MKRIKKKERYSNRGQLRVTLGYLLAHVAGWGTDTGAHIVLRPRIELGTSRVRVCICGAAMEKKDQRSCSLTRLIVKPRYLSGHRASASKTRLMCPSVFCLRKRHETMHRFFLGFGHVKLTSNTKMSNSRALSGSRPNFYTLRQFPILASLKQYAKSTLLCPSWLSAHHEQANQNLGPLQ